MKIIADGGSTKTQWLIKHDSMPDILCTSPGMNPSLQTEDELTDALITAREIISAEVEKYQPLTGLSVNKIEYYGAGCTPAASPLMKTCLRVVSNGAADIIVDSDIIGAAKALLGGEKGIACILGTGANSCLWDGQQIIMQTPALGYILGDEGSGAVLGKLFINAMYKGTLPAHIKTAFEEEMKTDISDIIDHVYRQPAANRWLASLSPFIHKYCVEPEVDRLVTDNFRAFLQRNIIPYNHPDLPVSFVGSIAWHYKPQLLKALEDCNLSCGKIMQSPLG